jgi:hypothetical protein
MISSHKRVFKERAQLRIEPAHSRLKRFGTLVLQNRADHHFRDIEHSHGKLVTWQNIQICMCIYRYVCAYTHTTCIENGTQLHLQFNLLSTRTVFWKHVEQKYSRHRCILFISGYKKGKGRTVSLHLDPCIRALCAPQWNSFLPSSSEALHTYRREKEGRKLKRI